MKSDASLKKWVETEKIFKPVITSLTKFSPPKFPWFIHWSAHQKIQNQIIQ